MEPADLKDPYAEKLAQLKKEDEPVDDSKPDKADVLASL